MSQAQIKLSVCVPTYNRCRALAVLLESLRNAIDGKQWPIEIVVCDNCSTDATANVVSEFINSGMPIRYVRRQSNIGGERNFYEAVRDARGEYVWLIGDDDRIHPDAFSVLMPEVAQDYAFMVLNYSVYSDSFSVLRVAEIFGYDSPGLYKDRDDVMRSFGPYLSFISSVVFRQKLFWALSYEDYVSVSEYGLSFLYAIYAGMKVDCNVRFVSRPILDNLAAPCAYDWYKYFVDGTDKVFSLLRNAGYSNSAVRAANQRVLSDYVLYRIVNDRIAGDVDFRSIREKVFRVYKSYPFFWLVLIPILFLPPWVLGWVKSLAHAMRKQRVTA